jgi:hypothetical protein
MAVPGTGVLPPGGILYNELAAATRRAFQPRLFSQFYFGPTDFSDTYLDRSSARKKSLALMVQWLDPAQQASYTKHHYFEVHGSAGGRYRVDDSSTSFNVREIKTKFLRQPKLGDKFCFQPTGAWAQGDVMLAQKIMLETDEPRALQIANRSRT